jgi:hypothetical protein
MQAKTRPKKLAVLMAGHIIVEMTNVKERLSKKLPLKCL